MRPQLAMLLILAAACGSSSNNNKVDADTTKHDAKVFMDAPPNVPPMITISGTADQQTQNGGTPLPGATVAIFKRSDENTALGTATTDAQGKYSLQIPTGGMVVDGFVKTSKTGFADNYAFPSKPWQADDASADPQMISSGNLNGLTLLMGVSPGQGVMVINVVDASGHAVVGATISTSPAANKYAYSGSLGPDTNKPNTQDDGIGYAAGNLVSGDVTISADKAGSVFKSHVITAHGAAFTTTSVTE